MSGKLSDPVTIIVSVVACLLSGGVSLASEWIVLPADSRLTFVAEQQGAKFTGRFETFNAAFTFDPAESGDASLRGRVDTASVNTFNQERDDYLRGTDWFDSARWPQAVFETIDIEPSADGDWVANARLTLRDVTRPVTMRFRFTPPDGDAPGRLKGTVELSRLEFGVGQGIWTNTDWVGDVVRVQVELALREAAEAPDLQNPGPVRESS